MRISGFTAMLSNCTLCLIKPHAIEAGFAGHIIDRILEEGFEISAMSSYFLDRTNADEFMDLYKGIIPDFQSTID
jgi:nucleoside-diphosphate kinase